MLELGDCSGPGRAPAMRPVAEWEFASTRLDHPVGSHAFGPWLPNMRMQRTRRPRFRSGRSLRSLGSPLMRRPLGSRRIYEPLIAIALGLALLLSACEPCGTSLIARVGSPSHHYDALIFGRDCGATTDFSTQVSLIEAGAPLPKSAGNLFIADTDRGKVAAGPGGGPTVQVRWLSEDRLEVAYPTGTRVFKQEPARGKVKVEYVQR